MGSQTHRLAVLEGPHHGRLSRTHADRLPIVFPVIPHPEPGLSLELSPGPYCSRIKTQVAQNSSGDQGQTPEHALRKFSFRVSAEIPYSPLPTSAFFTEFWQKQGHSS